MSAMEEEKNIQAIDKIKALSEKLENRFSNITVEDGNLARLSVSFQADRQWSVYRWYQYRESFSADLIHYLFNKYHVANGDILDPFAGRGTALFVSRDCRVNSHGIELLPIGQEIIRIRKLVENGIKRVTLERVEEWASNRHWKKSKKEKDFIELRITRGAYPGETEQSIRRYLKCIDAESPQVRQILFFALLSILESVSFTKKDGQCLQWDYRSGRTCDEKQFDKGEIRSFDNAIIEKLNEIIFDLKSGKPKTGLFEPKERKHGEIFLYGSSCLDQMPKLEKNYFGTIITSPPYCNSYDYTRTYALELAMLGVDENNLKLLRQKMLSCTVENRKKDLLAINSGWKIPLTAAKEQELLQEILSHLQHLKDQNLLNNDGIFQMVKGYFYEMSCVIYECCRVLRRGGYFFMVNDNVKYAGISIPIDVILSDFASSFGFDVKNILIFPQGNGSRQMSRYGREASRKCVYVWRKG